MNQSIRGGFLLHLKDKDKELRLVEINEAPKKYFF